MKKGWCMWCVWHLNHAAIIMGIIKGIIVNTVDAIELLKSIRKI